MHAEDDPRVVEAVRLTLASEPVYTWAGAHASAQGLAEAVRRAHPDLLLLDLDLPGGDPFAALRDTQAQHPALKTLILSGLMDLALVERAVDAGANGYVSKLDTPCDLRDAVRRVLDGDFVFGPLVQASLR
jgi:two-component system response regulator DesR